MRCHPRPDGPLLRPAVNPRPPAASAGVAGKGKFPKPPYPAFAKTLGLAGSVTLSVRVAPDVPLTGENPGPQRQRLILKHV